MSYPLRTSDAIRAEGAALTPVDFEGVDGVLLSARIESHESQSLGRTVQIAWGYLFGDRKGRFRDGEFVRTSYFTQEPQGDVYKALNSTYRIRLCSETANEPTPV